MKRVVIGFDAPGRGRVVRGGAAVVDEGTLNVLERQAFAFGTGSSEADQYRTVYDTFDRWAGWYDVAALAIEHPFLHAIAQWVGAAKGWAAVNGVGWYMITASSAKKAVLGDGRVGKAAKRAGRDAKADVLDWASERAMKSLGAFGVHLEQHEADAILYATAVILKTWKKEGG